MSLKASSRKWLKAHCNDEYVKRSKVEGYRSRAVYKLKEVDEKIGLIQPHMTILELGAAPGGWTQYVVEKLNGHGKIIAVDCLPMDSLPDVHFILGDFTEAGIQAKVKACLKTQKVDVLLSDMAPNLSGIKAVDAPRALHLAEITLETAHQFLKEGGNLMMKLFHGPGFDGLVRLVRQDFKKVSIKKPRASRSHSKETYLLGQGFFTKSGLSCTIE